MTRQRVQNISFLIISALLLAYTIYRASHICFGYDESRSYFEFSTKSIYTIFKFPYLDANNHVLNSLLMKFMGLFGPPGQLLLRTPNLCAHALFLVSIWLLLGNVRDTSLKICLFAFVNLNPFMLDYFSMARGYGLSLCFLAVSLYFLKELIENKKNKPLLHQSMSLLGALLAVLSNFNMIMYYCALCIVLIFWIEQMIFRNAFTKRQIIQSMISFFLASLPIILYVIPKILELRSAGELYFGGAHGFWADSVESLVNLSLYGKTYPPFISYTLEFFTITTILTCIFLSGRLLIQMQFERIERNSFFFAVLMILTFCAIGSILNHYIFLTPYPTERTALYLLVLFNICTALLITLLFEINRKWILAGYFICFLSIVNFANAANLTDFLQFKGPVDSIMKYIEKEHISHPSKTYVSVSSVWFYGQSMAFYQTSHNDNWMRLDKDGKDSTADYFVAEYSGIESLGKKGYHVVSSYPNFKTVLLKMQVNP